MIKSGSEINLCYGAKSNRYLYKWYGFVCSGNPYDSLTFVLPADPRAAMIYRSLPTVEERRKAGRTFRSKFHRIDILLVIECRKRLLERQQLPTSTSWHAVDLESELLVLAEYRSHFSHYMQTYSRSAHDMSVEFKKWKDRKIDYGQYCILVC